MKFELYGTIFDLKAQKTKPFKAVRNNIIKHLFICPKYISFFFNLQIL